MLGLKLVLLVALILVTYALAGGKKGGSRKAKFLNFNTDDDDVVTVELDFSIPFMKIPVKKAMESTFGPSGLSFPSLNVNAAGLVIAGVVIFGTVVLIPLLMKTGTALHPHNQYSRMIDSVEFGADSVLNFANHLIVDRSLQGCALRIACSSARKSGSHAAELLNQVTRNHILYSLINATALEEAINNGRQGSDCNFYGPCSLREDQIPVLLNSLSTLVK